MKTQTVCQAFILIDCHTSCRYHCWIEGRTGQHHMNQKILRSTLCATQLEASQCLCLILKVTEVMMYISVRKEENNFERAQKGCYLWILIVVILTFNFSDLWSNFGISCWSSTLWFMPILLMWPWLLKRAFQVFNLKNLSRKPRNGMSLAFDRQTVGVCQCVSSGWSIEEVLRFCNPTVVLYLYRPRSKNNHWHDSINISGIYHEFRAIDYFLPG